MRCTMLMCRYRQVLSCSSISSSWWSTWKGSCSRGYPRYSMMKRAERQAAGERERLSSGEEGIESGFPAGGSDKWAGAAAEAGAVGGMVVAAVGGIPKTESKRSA